MKILHLDTNHPLLIDQLNDLGCINVENYSASKSSIEKIIKDFDGIVIRSRFKIDKTFIDAATNLKFIARVGAGLESIDVQYAEKKEFILFRLQKGIETLLENMP